MGGSRHLVVCSITYKAYGSHLSNNLAHIHQESLLELKIVRKFCVLCGFNTDLVVL